MEINTAGEIDRQYSSAYRNTGKKPDSLYLGPSAYLSLRKHLGNICWAPCKERPEYMGLRLFILSPQCFEDEWHIKVV